MLGNLGSHNIAVIALGHRYKDIGFFYACPFKRIFISAIAQ
jgi:hypothetical protein